MGAGSTRALADVNEHQVHIHINLDVPVVKLQQALGRVLSLTAYALHCNDVATSTSFALPASTFELHLGVPVDWTPAQARQDAANWHLACGLRDAVEFVNLFLDEVNKALSGWQLAIRSARAESVTLSDMKRAIDDQPAHFHKLGMPDKIRAITSEYNFSTDDVLTHHVLSINAARRCLVHRFGLVGSMDSTRDGVLSVTWQRLAVSIAGPSGERIVIPPAIASGGELVRMVTQQQAKTFALGSQVSFTQQEFAELLWTFLSFGLSTLERLKHYASVHGLTINEASAAAIHPQAEAGDAGGSPVEPLQ